MSTAAERQRRYRERLRAGRRVAQVEVDEVVEDALLLSGLLARSDADDQAKIDAALKVAIERWAKEQVEAGIAAVTRNAIDF